MLVASISFCLCSPWWGKGHIHTDMVSMARSCFILTSLIVRKRHRIHYMLLKEIRIWFKFDSRLALHMRCVASQGVLLFLGAGPQLATLQDIAFNIVNKDWEYSHKRGFKCTFERGVLHLYFNFNRARYRR